MKSLKSAPQKFVNFIIKNFFCLRSDIRFLLYFLSFVFILTPSLAGAAQLSLAWDGSTGAADYIMHYGNYSGNYPNTVNVGNSTSCTISGLEIGKTYYFAVTARDTQNNESDFSNEVSHKIPDNPPPPPINRAPGVDAGSNQTITLPENSVVLDGAVTDDGLPGGVSTTWSRLSGPGIVTFDDDAAVDAIATFSEAGTYVLELMADDGELDASDVVSIVVNEDDTGGGSSTDPLPPPPPPPPPPPSSSNCTLNAKFQEATLNKGIKYYTDRNYSLTSVPSDYVGMDLIETPNDDRNLTTANGYLTFELTYAATVYVAYDSRATSLPSWMSGFSNTGDRIYTSLTSQPYLKVYSRSYSAGACANLGANKATGFSGRTVSNYIVFYGTGGGSSTDPLPSPPSTCTLNAKFQETALNNGIEYYSDRSYTIQGGLPSFMVGRTIIKTPNDERLNNASSGYMRFSNPVDNYVYVLFDSRAANLPDWLDQGGWEKKSYYKIYTSLSSQPYLQVWRKRFSAGACVDLGGNYGSGSSTENRSNFAVIYGK